MKIAIVVSTFPPYAGGIGNVAAANARELVRLGHSVTVFTPAYAAVTEEVTDTTVKRVPPLFTYGNAAFVPSLHWMLKGFDIIHLHYPFFGGAETLWLYRRTLKKKYKAKIIVHYHMDVVGERVLAFFFTLHKLFFLPRIVKLADKVLVTSADYAKYSYLAKFLNKDPQHFYELPNGVDATRFSPTTKDVGVMERHGITADEHVVLFVGGLDQAHYFKGVGYLIEAMSRLKQAPYLWKLVIVGEGDLKIGLQSLAKQLHIDSRTVFSGYVEHHDLPKYYNIADVVVLPSIDKSEAFGLALVEGMACAKPVVASNLAGVRSVIDDQKNGLLVELKNADDLAAKINYILANPDVAVQFGVEGRKKVEERYSWGRIGEELERVYKAL